VDGCSKPIRSTRASNRCWPSCSKLEKLGLGHQPWEALGVIVEENRAKVNFESVERLAQREEVGRLRQQ
jgi:hypothetical protein